MLTEDYDDWDYYDYVQNIDLEFTKYEGSALHFHYLHQMIMS